MKHILENLITEQIRMGVIKEEERELYEYGYLIMCEWGFNIVMAVLIGLITGAVQTTIIFLLSIIPLRSFGGGYHAKTPGRCAVISNGALLFVILFSEILFRCDLPVWSLFLCECLLTVWFFCRVPAETPTKPLDRREKKIYGNVAKGCYIVELVIMAAMSGAGIPKVATTMLLVHVCVVCSLEMAYKKYADREKADISPYE